MALSRDLFDRLLALARVAEPGLDVAPLPLRKGQAPAESDPEGRADGSRIDLARSLHRLRRRRELYFDAELFSEPAWDFLLDLYVATFENRPTAVTGACKGAAVPTTTALRWLALLESRGLVERESDRRDARRNQVRLSSEAMRAMRRLLTDLDLILTAEPEES